ncbi:MAG: FAD-dependent oxidoreductase [archaeon]|nr:FAD-dependent oxidoreductase [archaeon]
MENYDILIIGAGPAGLSAGLYAGRQNSKALILDKGLTGGLGLEVPMMENYPGFEAISGLDLIVKMKNQTEKFCEIKEHIMIKSIKKEEDGFLLEIKSIHDLEEKIDEIFTKSIILATGASHRHLNVPGEDEYLGRGVSYCATCDGMFFTGRDVLMIGGGNSAAQEAIFLKNLQSNVKLVHSGRKLRCDKHLQDLLEEKEIPIILNAKPKEIKGNMMVESVIFNINGEEEEIPTNGVFISLIGNNPSNELAKELGVALDEDGYIITDKNQATNIENVYAAGDITGGLKQWVVACSEGAIAATSAYKNLEKL